MMFDENILTILHTRYPFIDFREDTSGKEPVLRFSTPFQTEYDYSIWVSTDKSHSSIGAELKDAGAHNFFWYESYEAYYDGDLNEFVVATMDILVNHKTRIVQKKGILIQRLTCEYYKDGTWYKFCTQLALRYLGIRCPKIEGRMRIYQ